jgi:hypothetical protein
MNRPDAPQELSVKYAQDALILFEVAAIFAVITRNADRSHHGGLLAPDTGACHCGAGRKLARTAKIADLDANAVERTIEFRNVAWPAV